MTNEERRAAFEGRLRGETWEAIGARLGYEAPTVFQDLKTCLDRGPRRVNAVYPVLGRLIQEKYGGNVRAFALDCGLNPNTVYSILKGRMPLGDRYAACIAKATGLDPQGFRQREDRHAAV